jgi:hypothetical protein
VLTFVSPHLSFLSLLLLTMLDIGGKRGATLKDHHCLSALSAPCSAVLRMIVLHAHAPFLGNAPHRNPSRELTRASQPQSSAFFCSFTVRVKERCVALLFSSFRGAAFLFLCLSKGVVTIATLFLLIVSSRALCGV